MNDPGGGDTDREAMVDRGLIATWLRFWFTPTDARPLAAVRILSGALGLALATSYAGDLETWFGPTGMLSTAALDGWQPGRPRSVFDLADTAAVLWALFGCLFVSLGAMTVGLATRVACLAAAVLWAALLVRAPVLAGPADDCLSVLLWCLAAGPCGAAWSVDRFIRNRRGLPAPSPTTGARISLGLLRVHAAAITAAVLLAQAKGDVWWEGTASWWLAARSQSRVVDLTGLYRGSEYLMNLVTHAIVGFEILFAGGLWFAATRGPLARTGLVAWPAIGILAGEPFWGLAMAIFCVPNVLVGGAPGYSD